MLFSAQDLKTTALDEATALLEGASYLSDAEAQYHPQMVPIRENARLGKNVVRVEDLVEYSLANGITDGGCALQQICEASGVDMDSVVFSVDETSILESVDMEDTVRGLKLAGATVYAAPLSENNVASLLANTVADFMVMGEASGQTDATDGLLEAYINDSFDVLFSEDVVAESFAGRTSSPENKLQNAMNLAETNTAHWTASKISALRNVNESMRIHAQNDSNFVGIAECVIAKNNQAIEFLGRQLKTA